MVLALSGLFACVVDSCVVVCACFVCLVCLFCLLCACCCLVLGSLVFVFFVCGLF